MAIKFIEEEKDRAIREIEEFMEIINNNDFSRQELINIYSTLKSEFNLWDYSVAHRSKDYIIERINVALTKSIERIAIAVKNASIASIEYNLRK